MKSWSQRINGEQLRLRIPQIRFYWKPEYNQQRFLCIKFPINGIMIDTRRAEPPAVRINY